VATKHHERGVIFLAEKFEARGIFDGVNGIFLGEADGVRAFECVKVCKEGVD